MHWDAFFFLNSALLGVGLAMDAFSVSLADGLSEPEMPRGRMCLIAGVFAGFQALMPMLGWLCVHTVSRKFQAFERFIPWVSLILLLYIGAKMLLEGLKAQPQESPSSGLGTLLVQGIATSIDALSVGFAIALYGWLMALVCSLIISAVTFVICFSGLIIGKKCGTRFSGRAEVFGGALLMLIGVEIFLKGIL